MSREFASVLIFAILAIAFIVWYLIKRRYTLHGKIIVDVNEMSGRINYSLEIDIDPSEIQNMKRVYFEVIKTHHEAPEVAN